MIYENPRQNPSHSHPTKNLPRANGRTSWFDPQAYSKIESGKTKLSLDRIQQIAQILNIDVTELIHNNDNGVFLLINENCTNENLNNGAIIYHGNQQSINEQELKHDNEKMQLIITHKDEIIEQLKQENALLKQMLNLLNTQQTNQ